MAKKTRRSFTKEFKSEAVRLCKVGDRSIGQVARDLDLTETALRAWVKQAEVDAGQGRTIRRPAHPAQVRPREAKAERRMSPDRQ